MRITREFDVVQVTFLPKLFPVNVYLVEEEDGLTLIDAGMPFSLKGILATAQSLGKPITKIILTHAHSDHIGALDLLKEALPQAEFFISRRDARLLAGDTSLLPDEPQTPVRGGVPKPKAVRTQPDRFLDDGDQIGSLVAIASPGHTPGHMAFMDTRSRVLIAGDAYQLQGGLAVSGRVRPLFPFPALATWNREAALASAKRLAELEPSVLAVGHGRMLRQPAAAMRAAAADAQQRLGLAGGQL
ncbi:MBL fold metallo-hydrolase [Paenibacillus amylolyticus]|uniref:Beta-lactamase domain-containing protein n=1 Tax=Paenibacillus amylolyticus TaxID=1451 RepID=A0A100VRQ1_PAEAM|nr:MBL fold metallo-hydrolase [Paenibacillus amylolyticus]GAS84863.1 beta-lactamase domain-containing protein [Paenibacillus amylolyticus]